MDSGRQLMTFVAVVAGVAFGGSHSQKAQLPLSDTEAEAVSSCLTLVRECQLPDGAFAQVKPGDRSHAPVWIAPYFANYAALALLAGSTHMKSPDDLNRVVRWLEWCAKNQHSDGYWNDFEGTVASYKSNAKVDAWDSSAALFLLVAGRCHRAGYPITPAIIAAAQKAFACIERVTDTDGLTWAKPDYTIKFLMDNVEVRAGLREASEFFAEKGLLAEAKKAGAQADRIALKLPDFWRPADQRFAFALHPNGAFESGLDKPYPHGLAQLFGIAFITPKLTAWESLSRAFSPETEPAAAAGVEWWLAAATRFDSRKALAWRAKMVHEVAGFAAQNAYVYRPARTVLALLEGADWMPN